MTLPLPMVIVSGTPSEIGAAYGAAAAELIVANTAAYLERFHARAGLTRDAVRRAGGDFRAMTVTHHPRIAAMLDGVAEGAGVAVDEVYALNARTELLYGTPPVGECTALGVLDTHTASGHTLLAQNWDWHPTQRPYTVLLATRDERGFGVLSLAEAGMLAKVGLNSAGLGVCVNMLGTSADGAPGGVPYHVLLRAVMEAPTLNRAVRAACATPRSASINLLIGQAFDDASGEILDLEVVPGDVGVLNPVDGLLTHGNHLETAVAVRDWHRDAGGSSYYRAARARRLAARALPADEVALAAILADHGGYPQAICRHDVDSETEDERSETLYSAILDLDERRMALAEGPPCTADGYTDVLLDKVFD